MSSISERVTPRRLLAWSGFAVLCCCHAAYAEGPSSTGDRSWASVFAGEVVRFVRISYMDADWDDGMDPPENADLNLLAKLSEFGGGVSVAKSSESIPIRELWKFRADDYPPLLYMTGSGRFSFSRRQLKTLRHYLRNGGMLFGDSGSPEWHASFVGLARQLLPQTPLVRLADDDLVFREPYTLKHGAPPLWHHGGKHMLGAKHGGRWVVLYHPGDINDAWKTGHSGLDPSLADAAFRLGVNVIFYAWQQRDLARAEKLRMTKQKLAKCPRHHTDIQSIPILSASGALTPEAAQGMKDGTLIWWGGTTPPAPTAYVCRVCKYVARPRSAFEYGWFLAQSCARAEDLSVPLPAPLQQLSVALLAAGVETNTTHRYSENEGTPVSHSLVFEHNDAYPAAQLEDLVGSAFRDAAVTNLVVTRTEARDVGPSRLSWRGLWEEKRVTASLWSAKDSVGLSATVRAR